MSTGKANRIQHDLLYRLSKMERFGESKHEAKSAERESYLQTHGNLSGYNPCKVSGIFSYGTRNAYQQTAREFASYAAAHGAKNANAISSDLAAQYLKGRQDKSAWTVSKDMSAINKMFDYGFTKKELGLPSRHKKDIIRSREDCAHDSRNHNRDADAMTFAMACGCRRQSVMVVSPQDLMRNESGQVVAVHLTEKGGKERNAPILNEYKQVVTEIVERHTTEENKPLFSHYDVTIDNHAFRAEYARNLMHQLEEERAAGLPLCGGDFTPTYHLRGKDASDNVTYRGHDRDICGMVSSALGHNRLEIIFSHYRCDE